MYVGLKEFGLVVPDFLTMRQLLLLAVSSPVKQGKPQAVGLEWVCKIWFLAPSLDLVGKRLEVSLCLARNFLGMYNSNVTAFRP